MILNKIKKFFLKNKKEILFLSFFLIFIFSIWDNTFAATTGDTKAAWAVNTSGIVEWMNFFLKIFATLVWLLASLISLLLNPGWINGTIFGLDVYMKDIWILISNIVYFAFAFILIIIAFMNIVGKWWGTWELKSALPKFVVWVVMVPFTWFFVQFILSISAFLTISVLSLPYDIMHWKAEFKQVEKQKICLKYTFDLNTNKDTKKDSTKQLKDCLAGTQATKDTDWDWAYIWDVLNWNVKSNSSSSSIFSLINIYTYWVMQVDKVTEVTKDQLQWIKSIWSLTVKVIFDFLFLVVFLIILIALFMALFARWTWLWIYAMFSPVFWLLFFFWKSKEWVNKISPVEFIKLAMVPVYVSAALAFWMIFMFTAAHWLTDTSGWKQIFTKDSWDNSSTLQLWVFSITLKWIQWWDPGTNWIFSSLWNWIWQLLLEIFWLVLLWIAVMAALKSSEITHNVVKPIISFGESIWSLVSKAPQYAPIFPTPNGMTSAWWMAAWMDQIRQNIASKWKDPTNFLANTPFWNSANQIKSSNAAKAAIEWYWNNPWNAVKKLADSLKGYKNYRDLANSEITVNNIKDLANKVWLKKIGITKEELEKIKNGETDKVFDLLAKMEKYFDSSNWSYGSLFDNIDGYKNNNLFKTRTQIMNSIGKNWWKTPETPTTPKTQNPPTATNWIQNVTSSQATQDKVVNASKKVKANKDPKADWEN